MLLIPVHCELLDICTLLGDWSYVLMATNSWNAVSMMVQTLGMAVISAQ